jgi:hypothetical protein
VREALKKSLRMDGGEKDRMRRRKVEQFGRDGS